MQDPKLAQLFSQAALLVPDTQQRRVVLPAILGMAMGNFLQVTQSDVNPVGIFNELHAATISRAVSRLNEDYLIDVNAAIDAARAMYLVRYRILNSQPCDYSVNPEFNFMAVALGLSAIFPVDTINHLTTCGQSAVTLYTLANIYMADSKFLTKF